MVLDKEKFEKEGLKIDKERLLIYSGLICPLDCKYCFTKDIIPVQKENNSYLSEKQFNLLKHLPNEVNLIMLGCDTEFFQSQKDSLEILEKLSDLNKDISVITKLSLPQDFIKRLEEIDIKLNQKGNFLIFSETIPCLDSAKEWEPKAPSPKSRIETLKLVYKTGIKTLVAIRPLLPIISDEELKKIIDLTKNYCYAYYSGPLYLKSLKHSIMNKVKLEDLQIKRLQPHWMTKGNIFYKIERKGQMELLQDIVQKNKKLFFEGAAEAIEYIKK
jgi:DNA repair photolyase